MYNKTRVPVDVSALSEAVLSNLRMFVQALLERAPCR
jgi:hypothetical protein